jgi:hypothetical protein
MQSKNKPAPTKAERAHIERVKALPCSVCDAPGPSECHEPEQGLWFASCAAFVLTAIEGASTVCMASAGLGRCAS